MAACCGRYIASVQAAGEGEVRALASVDGGSSRVASAVVGSGAPTAEALMRSRYTCFVLLDAAYLLATWAPAVRPVDLELGHEMTWKRLLIQDIVDGGVTDDRGVVEFTAVYEDAEGRGRQHERSTFMRHDGRWYYVDGQLG